jgi:hypothetical protein
MSLFERPEYQWRETFLILLDVSKRPSATAILEELQALGNMVISESRADDDGRFEFATVLAPDDFAAMDISCVTGDEALEQIPELVKEIQPNIASDDEKAKLDRIANCTARLDVLHFEQHSFEFDPDESEPDFMDPGGLFIVLERLAELVDGIIVDPQSASVM